MLLSREGGFEKLEAHFGHDVIIEEPGGIAHVRRDRDACRERGGDVVRDREGFFDDFEGLH